MIVTIAGCFLWKPFLTTLGLIVAAVICGLLVIALSIYVYDWVKKYRAGEIAVKVLEVGGKILFALWMLFMFCIFCYGVWDHYYVC